MSAEFAKVLEVCLRQLSRGRPLTSSQLKDIVREAQKLAKKRGRPRKEDA